MATRGTGRLKVWSRLATAEVGDAPTAKGRCACDNTSRSSKYRDNDYVQRNRDLQHVLQPLTNADGDHQ